MKKLNWNCVMRTVVFILPLLISISCVTQSTDRTKENIADMVLSGGMIYTVDEQNPQAEAVAIKGDRIVFVGDNDEVKEWIGDTTRIIYLEGKTVVPGLIDCHGYVEWYGHYQEEVSLYGTKNFNEVLERVKARLDKAEPGDWIFGNGWDHTDWPGKQFPTHERLSAISPDNPVWLLRDGGHTALANAKAMALAGVGKDTQCPKGGQLVKDPNNAAPTGIFVDTARQLIESQFPPVTREDRIERILRTMDDGVAVGITEIHDAGVSYEVIEIYKELAEQGRLKLRIYAMLGDNAMLGSNIIFYDDYFQHPLLIGFGDNHFTIRSIKLSVDGAMGSRGALLLEDYSDRPDHRGTMIRDPALIKSIAVDALRKGYQLNVHAIGDRANRLVLDMIKEALKENPVEDHRFRIEHMQLIALSDIPHIAQLGVIPSMQQTHATSDMYWAEDRVGPERVKGHYAWRKILDSGAIIAGGSAFPVESINPLWSFYSAVTRQNHEGGPPGGWYPEERMSMEEALKSFTIWAAYAAFEEDIKGSITPRKLADMVVFSKDIMKIPPKELLETTALLTIIGGKIVYQAESWK